MTENYNFGTPDCGPNSIDQNIYSKIKYSSLPNGTLIEGISTFIQIALFDINGRKIQQNILTNDNFFIDNTNRPTGLYFARLIDEKGKIHTIKIIL